MTRCQICGGNTSTKIKITDVKYSPHVSNELLVCKECFDLWVAGEEEGLLYRIKLKLTKRGDKDALS